MTIPLPNAQHSYTWRAMQGTCINSRTLAIFCILQPQCYSDTWKTCTKTITIQKGNVTRCLLPGLGFSFCTSDKEQWAETPQKRDLLMATRETRGGAGHALGSPESQSLPKPLSVLSAEPSLFHCLLFPKSVHAKSISPGQKCQSPPFHGHSSCDEVVCSLCVTRSYLGVGKKYSEVLFLSHDSMLKICFISLLRQNNPQWITDSVFL